MALSKVYAYRDDGLMANTRWAPRRIFCTNESDHSDKPTLFVVKLAQGRAGAAAMISEVVCTALLKMGGIAVLDSHLVYVGIGFANSYETGGVQPGYYYGTTHNPRVENGPPIDHDDLAAHKELVNIWVFDSWLCNIDREKEGNLLLSLGKQSKFNLIAADQSECFGGSGRVADGSWKRVMVEAKASSAPRCLQTCIYNAGAASCIRAALERIETAWSQIDTALELVPDYWWPASGVNPAELRSLLDRRKRQLETIVDLKTWERLNDSLRNARTDELF